MRLLKGKRVLVLGLGISGQSAVKFLLKRGASVTGVDRNPHAAANENVSGLCIEGMKFQHEDAAIDIGQFDFVVASPGISTNHKLCRGALAYGLEVIGEVELACREITQKCVGITGTNGKTTVTLLTAHILESAGIKGRALGNIGIPLTTPLFTLDEVLVIELSSFQLETLKTPFLDAGVILNITPDHLDRYSSIESYAAAKIGMQKIIKNSGKFYVEHKCQKEYRQMFTTDQCDLYGYDPEDYLYTDTEDVYCHGEKIFSLPADYRGKRSHDLENMIASYALCSALSVSTEQFLKGLNTFQKPPHRIELVGTIGGVNYYDDSKGTNIDAVIRAVDGLNGEVILIAGGVDKGFPYTSWAGAFKEKVKTICAIGQSKEKIKNDLGKLIPVRLFNRMDEAVEYASNLAKAGDNVLLSPGCSSYDMFKDYAHRGQEFQRLINTLKENKE